MDCVIPVFFLLLSLSTAEPPNSIRSLDFRNFSYPWPEGYFDPISSERTFTLVDGQVPLERDAKGTLTNIGVTIGPVKYGDLTGDGVDEALIFVSLTTGGSAIPGIVYVYQLRQGRPVVLWQQETGDRADGGLRDMRVEGGRLVLELNSAEGSYGDCCPTRFVRMVYRWNSTAFVLESKRTVMLPDP